MSGAPSLPPSQAAVGTNGLTTAGVALPVPVGEVSIQQLPDRLLGLARPVIISGQVVAQEQGSATVRTAAGDVVVRSPTPLPDDRPLTLQIPTQTPGAPLPRAMVYASPSPAPQPSPAAPQTPAPPSPVVPVQAGAGAPPAPQPGPVLQPGAIISAVVIPPVPRPAPQSAAGPVSTDADRTAASPPPGLGLILPGTALSTSYGQGQPVAALPPTTPVAAAETVPAPAAPEAPSPVEHAPPQAHGASAVAAPGGPPASPTGAPPASGSQIGVLLPGSGPAGQTAGDGRAEPPLPHPVPAGVAPSAHPQVAGPTTASAPVVAAIPLPGTAAAEAAVIGIAVEGGAPSLLPPPAAPSPRADGPVVHAAMQAPTGQGPSGAGWRGLLAVAGRILGLAETPPAGGPTLPASLAAGQVASATGGPALSSPTPPSALPIGTSSPATGGLPSPGAIPATTVPAGQPSGQSGGGPAPPLAAGVPIQVRVMSVTLPGTMPAPIQPEEDPALLSATVLATTTGGQPVVTSARGTLLLQGQAQLAPGTRLMLALPDQAEAESKPAAPLDLRRDHGWPAFRQALEVLAASDPALARSVIQSVLPQPNRRLTTNLVFFLTALRGGDVSGWLGEAVGSTLERSGQSSLLSRLGDDFRAIAKQAAEPLPDGWRAYAIPFGEPGQIDRLQLYVRGALEEGADGEKGMASSRRFLVEVQFSRLGPMQLDGLLRPRHLDLAVRTRELLPATLTAELTALFRGSLEATGFAGSIAFQTGARRWINLRSGQSAAVHA